jgi:hypothetical protein
MRKLLYIFVPIFIAVLLFGVVLFFLSTRKEKGALQVTSEPGSKVYLNGVQIGKTPLCKCELKDMLEAGEYTIKLIPVSGDFKPFEQKIKISPKVLTVVDRNFGPTGLENGSIISLSQISDNKDAQISVVSFPDAVQVFLDNNLQGQTPILLKNITDSDHELKLNKEGYKDKIVRIRTVLGYKLDALIFMGINPEIATASAVPSSTSSAIASSKVTIQNTPTGFLRVREDASVSSNEITQVKPGESYNLLDEKPGWYKIQIDSKTSGWISSTYAKKG